MSELTFIKGKDACLETSIEKMQNILKQAGFEIVEASWLNPVSNVYSVHIYDQNCPGLFTNGKGTSRKATLASALGEFIERLSTNYFFSDYWLEKVPSEHAANWLYYPDEKSFDLVDHKKCLTPELWNFYDATQEYQAEDLLSFNDSGDTIRAIPLKQVSTGNDVYFPMNILSNIYASNGLSAGNTHLEAQVQGLSEVFERWVKNKIMRENLCLPEIPETIVQQFHTVVQAREALQKEGIEVSMRDASLGGHFPVINVTLFEQKTGRCFASFGAHPIFEVALERTLTESLQGRQLGNLDGFQVPVFDEEAVAEDENIENHFIDSSGLIHARFITNDADYEFHAWDFSGSTEQQWQQLVEMVHQQGSDVYVAQYEHYDFPSCRIIVPGMSEIYPCTELVESNQNVGLTLRELLLSIDEGSDFESLVDELDSLGLSEHQGIASLIGLMPDPGSFWAQLKVSDLRFWLALAAGNHEAALESVQESLYFIEPLSEWGVRYKAFEFCLEMIVADQLDTDSAVCLFGQALTDKVLKNIDGKEYFYDEPLGLNIYRQSNRHQSMLSIYNRVRQVKQERFV
ncbi:30S ribosomal protein S12 methylthiotransferase accessory factor YcaO [Thiomicrorhabdus sp. ZW0627]|uniref:30S ribosomal protein S12 methylthiotransferase accessory factor YcaO n=1 Tax=Thiomicrorhabdus sp. ZW0627 TaxID=3039774 RepID=UPI002437151E|nr:30S ribosomal protein S12 methylthiotransferase accessory factor YcaO [Thiomicrorhabdus sp. ZW0627]MDG6772983.1 30S ribosomal protein S12 methylthiotransferase accessory factor YcaO [Thiomicrorhabdus sp. ZW0627]